MDSEADEIRRRMVTDAVERHELLVDMHAITDVLQSSSAAGTVAAEALGAALEQMNEKTTALTQQGATWRWEKQQCQNAVANHAKLLQWLDAPALLEETVQRGMYTEALSILQHVQQASTEARSLSSSESAATPALAGTQTEGAGAESSYSRHLHTSEVMPGQRSGGENLLSALLRRTQAALEHCMIDCVLPRLSGPLNVDSAFRLVQFLRLVTLSSGRVEEDSKLEELFLAARHQFISTLIEEARELPSASNRVKKYLQVYKVQVNEVLLQHSACFSDKGKTAPGKATTAAAPTTPLLHQWCRTQVARLEDVLAGDVVQINSSYELGQVWEQGYLACMSAAKMHCSMWPVLSALVVDRVTTLFDGHMKRAEEHYSHSIRSFSWKPSTKNTGDAGKSHSNHNGSSVSASHRLNSSLRADREDRDTPTNLGYRSFQSSFTGSFSTSFTTGSGAVQTDLIPPTELTDFPPLAEALNHFLHAANSIHRVLLPGMESFCLKRIVALLQLIARDLARDGDVLSTEEHSVETYGQVVQAFGGLFYAHVLKCVVRLFGEPAGKRVEQALAPEMTRLERVLTAMGALLQHQQEDEVTRADVPQSSRASEPPLVMSLDTQEAPSRVTQAPAASAGVVPPPGVTPPTTEHHSRATTVAPPVVNALPSSTGIPSVPVTSVASQQSRPTTSSLPPPPPPPPPPPSLPVFPPPAKGPLGRPV